MRRVGRLLLLDDDEDYEFYILLSLSQISLNSQQRTDFNIILTPTKHLRLTELTVRITTTTIVSPPPPSVIIISR
jgi:hypothetical protein